MQADSDKPAQAPAGEEEKRFFFIHIQKTAGTSVRQHLLANFDPSEVYPPPVARGRMADFLTRYLGGRLLVDLPASEQAQYRLFNGHMPFAVSQRLAFKTPPATMTVLREPVARTLSVLGQKKRQRPEFADASLEDIYNSQNLFKGQILNHQTKIFAVPKDSDLLSGYDWFPVEPGQLDDAKRNLEKVDVVGLQCDIPSFLAELEAKFGWVSLDSGVRENVGSETDVSQALLDRIAEDNAIDMEFYRYAEELVRARRLAFI